MARFAQYAMVASEEALNDSGWAPTKEEDLEVTVCFHVFSSPCCCLLIVAQGVYMGSGIGSLDDVYDTTVAYEKGVSMPGNAKSHPLILELGLQEGFSAVCTSTSHQSRCGPCIDALWIQSV